jgi:hypothetical protein
MGNGLPPTSFSPIFYGVGISTIKHVIPSTFYEIDFAIQKGLTAQLVIRGMKLTEG